MSFKTYLNESINDKGLFKAIFLASAPYSGKSYTLNQIKGGYFPIRVVSTDSYVEGMAKLYNINPTDAYKYFGGEKIKSMTKETLYHTINGMLPIAVDSTSTDHSNMLKRKGILEGLGYDSMMVYINTELETILNRLNSGERTRQVPEDFVKRAFEKSQKMKPYYQKLFPNMIEIDNDEGDLTDEIIIKSYNKVQNFLNDKNYNPIAEMNITKIKEQNEKYLVPAVASENELKKYVENWYRS
jgi:predicted kinase